MSFEKSREKWKIQRKNTGLWTGIMVYPWPVHKVIRAFLPAFFTRKTGIRVSRPALLPRF